jgi:hypothetical protein
MVRCPAKPNALEKGEFMGIVKALIAPIALVGLVLLFPTVAAAGQIEESLFRGGDEASSSLAGTEIGLPASARASSAYRVDKPSASQSKKKKCKKKAKRKNGKKRKCRRRRKPKPRAPSAPPTSTPQAGWSSGRWTGSYAENGAIELRFNVVGSRLYTGAFDSFFVSANCSGGTPDPSAIAPVEASVAASGDFAASGVYSPGFGLQLPWQISGHIAGKSLTNGTFSVGPYINTFGEQCSGTSHFVAQWFADYTL